MSTLSTDERARIVANNKSLRLIKNELEFLAERNVITDDAYDLILSALPAESPLRSGAGAGPQTLPTPSATPVPTTYAAPTPQVKAEPAQPAQPSLTDSFSNLSVTQPQIPARTSNSYVPTKPELCHAVALYNYPASDAGDLSLSRDDHISVTTYENAEWWSGTNVRTGATGIFPKNYVRVEQYPSTLAQGGAPPPQYKEKTQYDNNPYHSQQPNYVHQSAYGDVPPMNVANDQGQMAATYSGVQQPNKGKEFGKKVAGKFGNAAVFGAGATVGSNIINSIF